MSKLHPIFEEIVEAHGLKRTDTYRGWKVWQGRRPEPEWMATSPDYDAWTEGEGEWADNGQKADAPTYDALIEAIDEWFEENGQFGVGA